MAQDQIEQQVDLLRGELRGVEGVLSAILFEISEAYENPASELRRLTSCLRAAVTGEATRLEEIGEKVAVERICGMAEHMAQITASGDGE